jgi:hypothetical protein
MSTDEEPEADTEAGDEHLLHVLRAAARAIDPVPPEAVAAAISSFTWRTIDAELALLSFDSATQEDALAGVRGDGPRLLSFEADGVVVDLEVTVTGAGPDAACALTGQASPAPQSLELRRFEGNVPVELDHLGRFTVRSVPLGPLSIRCVLTATDGGLGRVVTTDWVAV